VCSSDLSNLDGLPTFFRLRDLRVTCWPRRGLAIKQDGVEKARLLVAR
jgi:hypothetical protein